MTYANFWKRTAAYLVDAFIYGMAVSLIGQFVGFAVGVSMGVSQAGQEPSLQALVVLVGVSFLVQLICYVLYYVWPECSSWQATIGKKIFGLKVTDLNGQRIGFWRSLGRNLGMIVSTIILGIGYLMCIWTEKKQCLHDQMAGCLVVDNTPSEKQGCAIAAVITLFIVPILLLVLGIIAAIALPQFAKAKERAKVADTPRNAPQSVRVTEKNLAAGATSLLGKVQAQQQAFLEANQHYATDSWHQFGMPVVENDMFCLTPDQVCNQTHKFQVILQNHAVTALRINTTRPYELTLPYVQGGKISCQSAKEMCKQIGF